MMLRNLITNPSIQLALFLGLGIEFAFLWRRSTLLSDQYYSDVPLPILLSVPFCLVVGYALAMIWWLIRQTKGQARFTFRFSRARFLATACLAAFIPFAVIDWVPWTPGGLLVMSILPPIEFEGLGFGLLMMAVASMPLYPVAAMIVHHTQNRRWVRLGFLAVVFWSVYFGFMLWFGIVQFRT